MRPLPAAAHELHEKPQRRAVMRGGSAYNRNDPSAQLRAVIGLSGAVPTVVISGLASIRGPGAVSACARARAVTMPTHKGGSPHVHTCPRMLGSSAATRPTSPAHAVTRARHVCAVPPLLCRRDGGVKIIPSLEEVLLALLKERSRLLERVSVVGEVGRVLRRQWVALRRSTAWEGPHAQRGLPAGGSLLGALLSLWGLPAGGSRWGLPAGGCRWVPLG